MSLKFLHSGCNENLQLDKSKLLYIRSVVHGRVMGKMSDWEFKLVWTKCLESLNKYCQTLWLKHKKKNLDFSTEASQKNTSKSIGVQPSNFAVATTDYPLYILVFVADPATTHHPSRILLPHARMRKGVKQSVLSICQSVSQSVT